MAGYDGSLRSDGLARDCWDTLDTPAGWAAALEAPADGAACARDVPFWAVFERRVAVPVDRGRRVPGG